MAWSGLGVNYNVDDATTIASDIAYLQGKKINKVRVTLPQFDNDSLVASWGSVAKTFKDAGFYVVWGVTNNTVTSAGWGAYASAVVSIAAASNDKCDEFQIGNELELHNSDIADETLRDNIRTLAASVKASGYTGKVSYAALRGLSGTDPYGTDMFVAEGIGDLDYLSTNVYPYANKNASGSYIGMNSDGYTRYTPQCVTEFGPRFYYSEFNLESDIADYNIIPDQYKVNTMRTFYKYIKDNSVSSAYIFMFRNTGSNNWAMRNTDGTFNNLWDVALTDNGRRSFVNI